MPAAVRNILNIPMRLTGTTLIMVMVAMAPLVQMVVQPVLVCPMAAIMN